MSLIEDLNDLLASGDKVTPAEYEQFCVRVEEAVDAGAKSGNVNYPRLVAEALKKVAVEATLSEDLHKVSPQSEIRVNTYANQSPLVV